MEVLYLQSKKEYKRFLNFKTSLYQGDVNYVDTSSFVLEDVLYKKTPFTKSLETYPLIVTDNGKDLCEAIIIKCDGSPYLQIGFFEAVKNAKNAVDRLIGEVKTIAKRLKLQYIVIGLNAHISYGVGILSEGFDFKNTFDSLYNKSYYKDYFRGFKTEALSTFRLDKAEVKSRFSDVSAKTEYHVEFGKVSDLFNTTERMRALCEKTISKTFLYTATNEGHFYHLMKDLKPFLKDENFIFAVDSKGCDAGFVFWHPDFNGMLKGGEKISTFKIIWGYLFRKKNIDTVKINAFGSLSPRATYTLLSALNEKIEKPYKYKFMETNFVWDNNTASQAINKRFFGDPHRKYEVYFLNAND